MPSAPEDVTATGAIRNRFDRMEVAGAFGDLGTLIPFVIAYLGVLKMDPLGVLLSFGIAMIACGVHYRTPIPVQPMKAVGAIAATQAAQSITLTSAMVHGASLVTGVIWLLLGLTGAARRVASLVKRPIVMGIVLGLGFGFMIEGARMMASNWWVGGAALLGTALLMSNRVVPAMLVLLVAGAIYGLLSDATLWSALQAVRPQLRWPELALSSISLDDLLMGAVFLALPQVPLTLGNAIIAITEENNRLFPQRRVNEGQMAVSTGLMNLLSGGLGGVPMCHGAGGMAGHVRFGARTGGAVVILGVVLIVTALFFSGSVGTLLRLFPTSILGVILFLTGAQLALGGCDISRDKGERFVTVVTAALAVWNVGIAFVVGVAAYALAKRGLLRL
ncbi:MAG: putative sulfate/molybdate transporter [Reyranella sp.]|uniref:putative sulfate/molybdate transporter n=1 Tax=Reyranella sp. TaxID=1929291 RepID=UPI003D105E9E